MGISAPTEKIVLKRLISDTLNSIGDTFPESIEIKCSVSIHTWSVFGIERQFREVLENLCEYCRNAMKDGGVLTIDAKNTFILNNTELLNADVEVRPHVVLTISHTGTGIPYRKSDKIFDLLFTLEDIDKSTGLLLVTSFCSVIEHGGFVTLYSEREEETAFTLYLPAHENPKASIPPQPETVSTAGHNELILLVDDELSDLEYLRFTLENNGYRVITTNDVIDAVDLYEKNIDEVKLVVIDLMSPALDSLATISVLQNIDLKFKIIATSRIKDNELIVKFMDTQIHSFVAKPYTMDTLLNTIHLVLTS